MEEFSFIFTVFFMLLGPIKLIPSFSGVTRGTDVRFKRSIAIWGVVIASVLCAFVALSGETLLGRYRISIDAVRIAGGLVLMISALLAIFQKAQPPNPGTGTPTAVQLACLAGCRSGHCATGRCATFPASTVSAS
jgi:multiple antibiotic resistance protein